MSYLDILAGLFLAGGLFYVYRLLRPSHVRSVYGYSDRENEVGHGLCMFGMVSMLSPVLLPISSAIWAAVLGGATLWFTARALTWGKRVPYATKWWWDWAHVVMLGGMAAMYAGFSPIWLTASLTVFWTWFGGYYLYELWHDLPSRKALYIGSDIAHAAMGIVMLLMTLFPSAMMPSMGDGGHHHNMPGMEHNMPMPEQPMEHMHHHSH